MLKKQNEDKYFFDEYQFKELYALHDLAEKCDKEQQVLDVYKLWLFIKKCFPQIDFITTTWKLNVNNVFKPFIYMFKQGHTYV